MPEGFAEYLLSFRPSQQKGHGLLAAPFVCALRKKPFLQVLLVALDHLLNHLAADRAGLAGGQIAVVALLKVDADLPWCVFTTKTQFYFEVNTHQGGLMFFDLLKICYPCYIPYRVFCDFSNKAVKDTNTLPVGSSRPSNR